MSVERNKWLVEYLRDRAVCAACSRRGGHRLTSLPERAEEGTTYVPWATCDCGAGWRIELPMCFDGGVGDRG